MVFEWSGTDTLCMSGSITAGNSTNVTLGNYNFIAAIPYTIKAYSGNINGSM